MNRAAKVWVALAWVGFALLPWHFASGAWFEHIVAFTGGGPRSAAGLVLTGKAWWLAPIALPLLLATWPWLTGQTKENAARWLVAAGILGLFLITVQGFAIGIRGWRFFCCCATALPGAAGAAAMPSWCARSAA
jgi:iron(III) transport system permease protein